VNEFEIKTAKQALKGIGVTEIYYLTEEENKKVFGSWEVDVIVQYEYKKNEYLTHCLFGNERVDVWGFASIDSSLDRISYIKKSVQEYIKWVEEIVNPKEGKACADKINNVVETQATFYYAIKKEKIKRERFRNVYKTIKKYLNTGRKGEAAYNRALKMSKKVRV